VASCCAGNALHGDDGVAEAVGRCLLAAGLPAGWSVAVGTRAWTPWPG
jgi:Ni,Fe-hydrogenase maturation factor